MCFLIRKSYNVFGCILKAGKKLLVSKRGKAQQYEKQTVVILQGSDAHKHYYWELQCQEIRTNVRISNITFQIHFPFLHNKFNSPNSGKSTSMHVLLLSSVNQVPCVLCSDLPRLLYARRRHDSVLICLGPSLVPDLFEVPMSSGIPTKHASRPLHI